MKYPVADTYTVKHAQLLLSPLCLHFRAGSPQEQRTVAIRSLGRIRHRVRFDEPQNPVA